MYYNLIDLYLLIFQQLHGTSYLLDKLLQRETLNMVIITLYPYSKGYSLSFCGTDGQIFQVFEKIIFLYIV